MFRRTVVRCVYWEHQVSGPRVSALSGRLRRLPGMLNRGETECMFCILNESGSDPGIKAAQGMDGGIDIDGKRPDRPECLLQTDRDHPGIFPRRPLYRVGRVPLQHRLQIHHRFCAGRSLEPVFPMESRMVGNLLLHHHTADPGHRGVHIHVLVRHRRSGRYLPLVPRSGKTRGRSPGQRLGRRPCFTRRQGEIRTA